MRKVFFHLSKMGSTGKIKVEFERLPQSRELAGSVLDKAPKKIGYYAGFDLRTVSMGLPVAFGTVGIELCSEEAAEGDGLLVYGNMNLNVSDKLSAGFPDRLSGFAPGGNGACVPIFNRLLKNAPRSDRMQCHYRTVSLQGTPSFDAVTTFAYPVRSIDEDRRDLEGALTEMRFAYQELTELVLSEANAKVDAPVRLKFMPYIPPSERRELKKDDAQIDERLDQIGEITPAESGGSGKEAVPTMYCPRVFIPIIYDRKELEKAVSEKRSLSFRSFRPAIFNQFAKTVEIPDCPSLLPVEIIRMRADYDNGYGVETEILLTPEAGDETISDITGRWRSPDFISETFYDKILVHSRKRSKTADGVLKQLAGSADSVVRILSPFAYPVETEGLYLVLPVSDRAPSKRETICALGNYMEIGRRAGLD
jgi:hypothetical protein